MDARSDSGSAMSIVMVLDAGNGVPVQVGIEPIDAATRSWLADRLSTGAAVPVSLGAEELDTEGHAMATDEVVVDLYLDDDVEGHAVRLRFPTREEAAAFRQGVLAAGRFVGSLQQGDTTPSHVALRPGAQINQPRSFHRG